MPCPTTQPWNCFAHGSCVFIALQVRRQRVKARACLFIHTLETLNQLTGTCCLHGWKLRLAWLAAMSLEERERVTRVKEAGEETTSIHHTLTQVGFFEDTVGLLDNLTKNCCLVSNDYFGQTDLLIARRTASCTSTAQSTITEHENLANLKQQKVKSSCIKT